MMMLQILCLMLISGDYVQGFAEPGKWTLHFNQYDSTKGVVKTVFAGSKVIMKIHCDSEYDTVSLIKSIQFHYLKG